MNHCFLKVFLLFSFFSTSVTKAQNISGTWEGYFNGEYLQLNVQQQKNELCGFTYDYELADRNSYCIANFKGRYDKEKKIYYLAGTGFIENSGSHVLMRIILWKDREDKSGALQGKVVTGSNVLSILGMGGDNITLNKISGKPKKLEGYAAPCFPEPVAKTPVKSNSEMNTPVKKEVLKTKTQSSQPVKPIQNKKENKPIEKVSSPVKPGETAPEKKDLIPKIQPEPLPTVNTPKKPVRLESLMATRKQSEQSRITIDVKEINLKLYDNGTVDNDSVSVFYNGRLLLSHQRLSEKAIELNIQLDEGITQHEITLFAENLGSIPPNTSLIVVTAGKNRYELRSKASMEENAVLIFNYKPK